MIVPAGKPEPVTFTLFTPETPLLGAVHWFSFTAAFATPNWLAAKQATRKIAGNPLRREKDDRRNLFRSGIRHSSADPINTAVPGSGTLPPVPRVASMTAKSPSDNVVPVDGAIVALKFAEIVAEEPSLRVMLSGLNDPVKVAPVGVGLVPPTGIGLPSNEMPSGPSAKYDEPNVSLVLFEKFTDRLRLERLSVVEIGNVVSGKADEFGPV